MQWRAMVCGISGKFDIVGNLESASCRRNTVRVGSNPTLTAILSRFFSLVNSPSFYACLWCPFVEARTRSSGLQARMTAASSCSLPCE